MAIQGLVFKTFPGKNHLHRARITSRFKICEPVSIAKNSVTTSKPGQTKQG